MRKHIPIIALVFLLVLPSLASAVYLDSVTGTADCNGWNTAVEITFRSGARMVRLEYTVALNDATGSELERFEYSEEVAIPDRDTVIYPFEGMWTSTLSDGSHSMTCDVVLFDIFPDGQNRFEDGFSVAFECGGDPDGDDGGEDPLVSAFCPRGPGYWKNHPQDWPVMDLDLGGENLNQNALLEILNTPVRGDATVILARALITAKLNLAGGGLDDPGIIAEVDAFLAEHPVFSNPRRTDRKAALAFMNDLGSLNQGDCPDESDGGGIMFAPDAGKSEAPGFDKAASVEVIPLGSLKALYR